MPDSMINVFGYVRISTERQVKQATVYCYIEYEPPVVQ